MSRSVTVKTSGPLFDGRADQVVDDMLDQVEQAIAQRLVDVIQNDLAHVLKHPTGYYRSHVHADRAGGDWQVDDDRVVYGPWLEGTSSRNRTTRFRGYATFRRAAQQLERRAGEIAEPIVDRAVERLNQ